MSGVNQIENYFNDHLSHLLQEGRWTLLPTKIKRQREYGEEDALSYMKRILGQQSVLNHSYEAMLPYSPAQFSSTFEVVESVKTSDWSV